MALMFWIGVLGLAAIVLAMVVERHVGRAARRSRAERGEWSHMAALSSMRDRAREDARYAGANVTKSVPSA